MNWLRVGLSVLLLAAPLAAKAQDAATKIATDTSAKWVAAYDAGDAAAIAALFSADGTFDAPSGAVIKGREAIMKALAGRIKAGWTSETISVREAHAAGDAIWATGEYSLTGSGEVEGKHASGNFGEVFVRDGDDWRLVLLTANVIPPKP